MTNKIAYFNGEYIKESDVKISIGDRGFLNGDAAFDIARTYNHRPFEWREHIDRWMRSLRYIQVDIGLTPESVFDISLDVFKRNEKALGPANDYRIIWRATPGEERFGASPNPTVLIHCAPIDFEKFARFHIEGVHVVIASTRTIPPQCLDLKAKLHSRASYVLAEIEAKSVDPDAYGLMLDLKGCLAECVRQNIFLVRNGQLLTPTRNNILEGVSRKTTLTLAQQLGIETQETNLFVYDLYNADEIFVTATSFAILPVSKVNNNPLETPVPGLLTKQLQSAWSKMVGVDIVQQALIQAQIEAPNS